MLRLNHITLAVADRERSAVFYGRYFGMTNRLHDDAHFHILGGAEGGLLTLSKDAPPPGQRRTTPFGFFRR